MQLGRMAGTRANEHAMQRGLPCPGAAAHVDEIAVAEAPAPPVCRRQVKVPSLQVNPPAGNEQQAQNSVTNAQ